MARIFISHSSLDNPQAIALRDWLVEEGWNDLFLDLDPERGIAAGERWERALNKAARRCEAVLFLISNNWLKSKWCMNELTLARRLNKRLFGVVLEEGLAISDLPSDVTSTWQLVNLATGRDHKQFRVSLPITGEEEHVTFSLEGLSRLKSGLQRAGLHASYFAWPPEHDPQRAPYRGLKPLEADDAGIFFGREAPVIEAIDRLRGLREAAPPRLLVILGASGAGKSSFLRAGLLPRLVRDDATFLPFPVIRPERAAITGETGLINALAAAFEASNLKTPRADLRAAIEGGAEKLKPYLQALAQAKVPTALEGEAPRKPPLLALSIDQGEELFLAEATEEAKPFLLLLRDLLMSDKPAVTALFTIRSDNYERLQQAEELEGVHQEMLNLPPMPKGSYTEVIKGPLQRLEGTSRALNLDEALVQDLLSDIEAGGAKDALPLLAFTLERLYGEYHASGHLKLEHYDALGRIKGSIEAAVKRAFEAADKDARIPKDRQARLALLRRGLIPWLAGIDPNTGAPRRRVARLSEIPEEARPLIDLLVEQRLLSTDIAEDTGETTIEPAHEALLRQWGLLEGWLTEDAGLLTVLDGIKRAARDWAANGKTLAWLAHGEERYKATEGLMERPDLAALLEPADKNYLTACRNAEAVRLRKEQAAQRGRARLQRAVMAALVAVVIALLGIIYKEQVLAFDHWLRKERPYIAENITPFLLTPKTERALKPGNTFRECAEKKCPEMVVIPLGKFMMGSPKGEGDADEHGADGGQVEVTIAQSFAVSKFEVTFDEWGECVQMRGCPPEKVAGGDNGWGRGNKPVINVSWNEAQQYVAWLSRITGKPYRLLTEAEWEYAARADTTTTYSFGDDDKEICKYANLADQSFRRGGGTSNFADCNDGHVVTAPVGRYPKNAFGLYDMHGNVWEWVQDCYHKTYEETPRNGASVKEFARCSRVLRGGSWGLSPLYLRSGDRGRVHPVSRNSLSGFG